MGSEGAEGTFDPVPPDLAAKAKSAFDRRAPGDLAALVHDSLLDDADPPENHALRFEHARLAIELRVVGAEGGYAVSGRLAPPAAERVQLEFERGIEPRESPVCDGAFEFDAVPRGIIRLHLKTVGEANLIHTDWFRI